MALGYLIIFLQYGRVFSTKNTGLELSGVFEVVYYKMVVYSTQFLYKMAPYPPVYRGLKAHQILEEISTGMLYLFTYFIYLFASEEKVMDICCILACISSFTHTFYQNYCYYYDDCYCYLPKEV